MSLFKRGNVWWYEFEFRGTRIRETAKTRNREVAGRIERERRRNLELGIAGLRRIGGPLTVAKAAESFLDERRPFWAAHTALIHQTSWRHVKPHFGKLLLQDVQPSHISRYQLTRQRQGASGRTVNIEVGLIRMVMIKHRIWHNISPDVRMLREMEDVGRALAPDEERRVLAAAQSSISRSIYPAILISMHTGLRSEELRTLQWRHIDFLKEEIRVGKSKTQGGEGRVIPLSATALATMKEWRGLFPAFRPDHFVFPTEKYKLNKKDDPGGSVRVYDCDPTKPTGNWKRAWTTCRKVAKVSCRWHDMRHTFVSRMGENKVADATLMSMTGHLSRKMLERYSHARMEAKRSAVRTLDAAPVCKSESAAGGERGLEPERSPQRPPQSETSEPRRIN